MVYICYWVMLIACIGISIYWYMTKQYTLEYLFIAALVVAIAGIVDDLFIFEWKMYYYVAHQNTVVYQILYDLGIYPVMAILFIRTMGKTKPWLHVIYWTIGLTGMELALVPTHVIGYTGWNIFPHSIIFYFCILMVCTYATHLMNRLLGKGKSKVVRI